MILSCEINERPSESESENAWRSSGNDREKWEINPPTHVAGASCASERRGLGASGTTGTTIQGQEIQMRQIPEIRVWVVSPRKFLHFVDLEIEFRDCLHVSY